MANTFGVRGGPHNINETTAFAWWPWVVALISHGTAAVRRSALASINMMLPCWPNSVAPLMDTYLQGLFTLANDTDNGVRKHVCSGRARQTPRATSRDAIQL